MEAVPQQKKYVIITFVKIKNLLSNHFIKISKQSITCISCIICKILINIFELFPIIISKLAS